MYVKEILKTRQYTAGYVVRHELIDGRQYGGEDCTMVSAYTPDGAYIGDSKWAYRLCTIRGIKPEVPQSESADGDIANRGRGFTCSIGFCAREEKWYGWSHRAIYGFGIGSTVQRGDCAYTPGTVEELFLSIVTPDEDGWAWQPVDHVEKIPGGVRIRHNTRVHTITNEETGELSGWVDAEPKY